jgi:hypothetical protein
MNSPIPGENEEPTWIGCSIGGQTNLKELIGQALYNTMQVGERPHVYSVARREV